MTQTTISTKNDTLWLLGVGAVFLLSLLSFSSYNAVLPAIQAEWAMSNSQAGVVFSAYLVGYATSSLVLISISDRVSTARLFMTGMGILTVGHLLFGLFATNFWLGMLLRFMAGTGHVAVYIGGIQLVSRRFSGRRRGTAVGLFISSGYGGTTLSFVVMGFLLAQTGSWRSAYLLIVGIGMVAFLLAFLLIGWAPADPTLQAATTPPKRFDISILKERAILLIIIGYALHTAELYLARLWLPPLLTTALQNSGMAALEATARAATLSGFMFMLGIVGALSGGFISDRTGRTAGSALIFALSGLCSFIAGWLVGLPIGWLITLGFVYGFATAADTAIYSTAITELAPPERLGSTQAVQAFIGFTIGAVVPIAAGGILDVVDSAAGWGIAFGFNGLLAVIGIIAMLNLRRLPQAVKMAHGRR